MENLEVSEANLQIDLHTEFDDATRGQTEIGRGGSRVARDEREERLAPAGHLVLAGREERFATEVVARVAQFDVESVFFTRGQRMRDVGRLHEAVTHADAEKPLAFVFDGEAFVRGNLGHVFARHGQQNDLLMQHLVVLEVVEQDGRGSMRVRRHEDGGAAHAMRSGFANVVEELFERQDVGGEGFGEDLSAALPRRHHREDNARDHQREPTAIGDFGDVSGEKREINGQEQRDGRKHFPHGPAPTFRRDDEVHA